MLVKLTPAEGDGSLQLQNGDVILVRLRVVVLVVFHRSQVVRRVQGVAGLVEVVLANLDLDLFHLEANIV